MAIPTEQDFSEWLRLVDKPLNIPPDVSLAWDESKAPGRVLAMADVSNYWRAIQTAFETQSVALDHTNVDVWLCRQKEFLRAEELVYRERKKRAPQEVTVDLSLKNLEFVFDDAEALALARLKRTVREMADVRAFKKSGQNTSVLEDDFDETTLKKIAKRQAPDLVRDFLERQAQECRPGIGWLHSCVWALREYYYCKSARATLQIGRCLRKAIPQAESSVATLIFELESAASMGFLKRQATLTTLKRLVDRLATATDDFYLPVRRNDVHAAERLFVFRLHRANRRQTKAPKIEAIAELMRLEGFAHQFDRRNLERICAEFTGK